MFKHYENRYVFLLNKKTQNRYWIIQELYRQQKELYDTKKHSTADRIVNICQPYIRSIIRGKDCHSVEFGAKISASESGGMSRVERISWDNFNESTDMVLQLEMYKKTYGLFPELLLADKLYLNRKNRKWLKEKEIRIVISPLGILKKNRTDSLSKKEKGTKPKKSNRWKVWISKK